MDSNGTDSNISSDMDYSSSGLSHLMPQQNGSSNNGKHSPGKSVNGAGACARRLRKQAGKGMQSAHSNPDISDVSLYESDGEQKNSMFGTLPRKSKMCSYEDRGNKCDGPGHIDCKVDLQYSSNSYYNNTQTNRGDHRQMLHRELNQKQGYNGHIPKSSSTPSDLYSKQQYRRDQPNVPYPNSSTSDIKQVVNLSKMTVSQTSNQKDRSHYGCPVEMGLRNPQHTSQHKQMPPPLPQKGSTLLNGYTPKRYDEPIYDYLPCQKQSGDHSRQSSEDSNRTLTPSIGEHSRDSSTASTMSNGNHSQQNSNDKLDSNFITPPYGYQRSTTVERWNGMTSYTRPQDHMASNLDSAQQKQLSLFATKPENQTGEFLHHFS